jgi:hypothetical protein
MNSGRDSMTSKGSGVSFLATLDLNDVILSNRCVQPPKEVGGGLIEDDDEFEEFGISEEWTGPAADEAEITQPWDKDESDEPDDLGNEGFGLLKRRS